MRTVLLICLSVLALATPATSQAAPQATGSPQQLFEAGRHDEALSVIVRDREAGAAADAFLAGQILNKANRDDEARREFTSLADSPDGAASFVGKSALAILDGDRQTGLEAATQAVAADPDRFEAQYQLGLAKAQFEDWAGSAEAFDRAAELNPTFAYAHYYAGLSYSRIKRADRTSEHLQRFLKLAPKAPERPAVESLMRTLRGR